MDIGTGIFFGFVFVGVVVLYLNTRDRWNWRKIILRPVLGLFALLIVVGAGFWAKEKYDARVIPKNSYIGLALGDTEDDVRFKKGVGSENPEQQLWGYQDEKGQWETVVKFRKSKVYAIIYEGECMFCNGLFEVFVGDKYDEVIAKFGEPSFVHTSKDKLVRWISYDKLNIGFSLEKGKVKNLIVYDGSTGGLDLSK